MYSYFMNSTFMKFQVETTCQLTGTASPILIILRGWARSGLTWLILSGLQIPTMVSRFKVWHGAHAA